MAQELEVKFLEIDKPQLISKLHSLNATDQGEILLDEVIFYDQKLDWVKRQKIVRVRKAADQITLTYKYNKNKELDGTEEIEMLVDDFYAAQDFLSAIGLRLFRHQQKYRHTFVLDQVTIDIDTWPKIPSYVELEGPNEKQIKQVASMLGFDWQQRIISNARQLIEEHYSIPVSSYKFFTFEKVG